MDQAIIYTQDAEPHLKGYILAATTTLLIYDYFCTLEQEISYMWFTPWSWGKILFILNRYMPFINIPMAFNLVRRVTTPEMCFQHYRVITWVMFWSMIFSEQVLLLRTVAIWGRQRWIIVFLLCLHIATIVPSIVTTSLFFKSLTYVPINENRYGCKVGESTSIIMVSFVMLLISETIIMVLTSIRALHLRHSNSPWVHELYQRGFLFYFYMFAITIMNVVVPIVAPDGGKALFADLQQTLHSLLCNRVIFHIWEGKQTYRTNGYGSQRANQTLTFTAILDTILDTFEDRPESTTSKDYDWSSGRDLL